MNKKYYLLFFTILLVGTMLATPDFFVPKDQAYNVTFQCRDDTQSLSICSASTTCNITIYYPNSTLLINNQIAISQSNGLFIYNLSREDTSVMGEYSSRAGCSSASLNSSIDFIYEVNPPGKELKTSDGILYFVLMFGVVFLFGLSLWGAITLPFTNVRAEDFSIIAISRLKYFKIMLWFFSYILFVWLLNLLHTFSISFAILTQFTNFFSIIFKVMNALAYPMFVLMLIIFFVVAVRDSKIKKLIERGFRPT